MSPRSDVPEPLHRALGYNLPARHPALRRWRDLSLQGNVEHVEHGISLAIHQDDVAADDDVLAVRRRGRQSALQIVGAVIHAVAQPRRQSSARLQLFFQARRQGVALGEPGGQVVPPSAVPIANLLAVAVGKPFLVFLIAVPVTLAVAMSMAVTFVVIVVIVAMAVFIGKRRNGKAGNTSSENVQPLAAFYGNPSFREALTKSASAILAAS